MNVNSSKPVVKVPIKCGLGNQMFGYAFYCYLRNLGYNTRMIWIEYIAVSQHNGVELLKVFPNIRCRDKWKANLYCWFNKFIYGKHIPERIAWRLIEFYYKLNKTYQQNNHFSFDIINFNANSLNLANGLWQNFRYAEPVKEELRKAFYITDSYTEHSECYDAIKHSNSVSIHIRRGDYLSPRYTDLNVLSSLEYYYRAINFIKEKTEDCKFFVFSDDIPWCRTKFLGDEYTFVDVNHGDKSYLDLYLMSQCRHNIIANSSFSYWGAWLNRNSNKIVCAPYKWTNTEVFSSDFCPQEWNFIKF